MLPLNSTTQCSLSQEPQRHSIPEVSGNINQTWVQGNTLLEITIKRKASWPQGCSGAVWQDLISFWLQRIHKICINRQTGRRELERQIGDSLTKWNTLCQYYIWWEILDTFNEAEMTKKMSAIILNILRVLCVQSKTISQKTWLEDIF